MASNYLRPVPSFVKSTIEDYANSETLPDVWFVAKSLAGGFYKSGNSKIKLTKSKRDSHLLAYPHVEDNSNKFEESTGVNNFKVTKAQAISLVDSYTITAIVDENDIDIVEGLFCAPGIHIVMEWGHRDVINKSLIYDKKVDSKTFDDKDGALMLQYKNNFGFDKAVKDSGGRYNYAIGVVVNFSHSYNANLGLYNVSLSLVGAGYIESFSLYGNIIGIAAHADKSKDSIQNLEDYIGENYINIGEQAYELFKIGEEDANHNLRMQEIMDTTLPPIETAEEFREMMEELVPMKEKENKEIKGQPPKSSIEEPNKVDKMIPLLYNRPEFIYYNIKSIIDYITSTSFSVKYYLDYNKNMEPINDSMMTYDMSAISMLGNYAYSEGKSFDVFISKNTVDQQLKWFETKTIMDAVLYLLELTNKSLMGYCKFTADMIDGELVIYDEYYVGSNWLNKPLLFDVSREGLQKGIIRGININTSVPKNVVDYWIANSYDGKEYNNNGAYEFFSSTSSLKYKEKSITTPQKHNTETESEGKKEGEKLVPEIIKYEQRISNSLILPVPPNTHPELMDRFNLKFQFAKSLDEILLAKLPDIGVLSSIIIKSLLYNATTDLDIDIKTIIKVWNRYVDDLRKSKKIKPKTKFDALPVDINLNLTGVAGLAPFMYFKMKGATSRMSGSSFYYMITSVEHEISNHNWDVKINAFLRTDMR